MAMFQKCSCVVLLFLALALLEGSSVEAQGRLSFPDNINIATVTPQAVNRVLRDPGFVERLVRCFEHKRYCNSRGELSFTVQVRRLGRGGRCFRCTRQEQARIKALMGTIVNTLQQSYPNQWRRLVPHLRNLF